MDVMYLSEHYPYQYPHPAADYSTSYRHKPVGPGDYRHPCAYEGMPGFLHGPATRYSYDDLAAAARAGFYGKAKYNRIKGIDSRLSRSISLFT
ncbi:hypothetical protein NP493_426g01070 [Ridgeia piscesae]|uniref:Uncharacterized protein n=1 Tax=Ridgeia piscesae TaxID=27915 RepID=A0AAD9L1P2_RIDPI|nr:hypothetical protein NP493_426g01070 [Ridgeia piscesae]